MDSLVGESCLTGKHSRDSNSSSPLVPELSIRMSPPHTEESNEVAKINSPKNTVFPLSVGDIPGPGFNNPVVNVMSPKCLMSQRSNSNTNKMSSLSPSRKRRASDEAVQKRKEDSLNLGEDTMDTTDEGFSSMNSSNNRSFDKESTEMKEDDRRSSDKSVGETNGMSEKETQVVIDSDAGDTGKNISSKIKAEVSSQIDRDREAASGLTGFVTLAARNGDSFQGGLALPSILSHHQNTPLNSCFPGSDGNWYQIISAGVPPVLTSQHLADNSKHTTTTTTTTTSKTSTTTTAGNSAFSFQTCNATSATTTNTTNSTNGAPITTPITTADPLLSFLQQYSAGSTDTPAPLPAIHLPLNLASTCGPPHTPRYIYATNPRTGQLLVLSSVGDLTGPQALQHHHQLQLQQQVMQAQQQQTNIQEKGTWKKPLGDNQQQNTLPTVSNGIAGKPAAKPGSLINQLLQNKLPCNINLKGVASQDENMPPVAAARELLALSSPARTQPLKQGGVPPPPLFNSSSDLPGEEPVRENHNMKERRRRARIKDACDLMRQLVPGMSDKTDKATVFEFSARYIHFLKNFVGTHHDKDFLIKYSPY
ncbi:hypothetical protein V1264_003518 [Littorina saxatilis]|uniref:BHLH domain-containing protein n=2 Tax=Littorina saxatilis TaxID=31220 RepID=A0AAN9B4X9_9CAEN